MSWYKKLDINQRIFLKEKSKLIVGITFTELLMIFGLKEAIEILHTKLHLDGML